MNANQVDSKFAGPHQRALIRREVNVFPLRSGGADGAKLDESGSTRYSKPLAVFNGTLIASAVVFVTITLALQAVARFS